MISSVLLKQITDHVRSSAVEVCGLLFGSAAGTRIGVADIEVTRIEPCRNVAADPARRFEIDPRALIGAHRAARAGGPSVIGHYHSHPSGSATPSARDAADAAPDGSLWLIFTHDDVCGWRAEEGGAVHGRFAPVALAVTY